MKSVNVAEAKARLSEIITGIERGGEVVITRRGRPVARLSSVARPSKPVDYGVMDALRARQPMAKSSSLWLIREMREEKY